jgi:chromosome segregation ATPase
MQHGLGLVAEAAAAAATAARQALAANRSSGNAVRARGDSLEAQIVQLELQLDGCRQELGRCRLEQSQLESRDAALEERVEQSAWAQVLADGEAWWEKAMPATICLQAAQRRRSALKHVARLREERGQQELRAAAPAAAAAPGPASTNCDFHGDFRSQLQQGQNM